MSVNIYNNYLLSVLNSVRNLSASSSSLSQDQDRLHSGQCFGKYGSVKNKTTDIKCRNSK